eukprot:TRINITY_DN6232_c0_g1_i1.p1 TRINITY_DN6232_c0_g1~~TRINITY_DN6232_c0_g1_i1.p1  ORF type:complete len:718 (-),score=138.52 TRINITY_DN6232_c0_g1_i1:35-2188(-)
MRSINGMKLVGIFVCLVSIAVAYNIKTYELLKQGDAVFFKIQVDDADHVYVAGDWNNFADNNNGRISSNKYEMIQIYKNTFVMQTLLVPGRHTFKYVINGDYWYSDPDYQLDSNGNAIFYVTVNDVSKTEKIVSDPHWSFSDIPFSNGYSAGKFNVYSRTVDTLMNHIYKKYDDQTNSVNLIEEIDFKIGNGQMLSWMQISKVQDMHYDNQRQPTGIVSVNYSTPVTYISMSIFSSFLVDNPNLVIAIQDGRYQKYIKEDIKWNPDLQVRKVAEGVYSSNIGNIYVSSIINDHDPTKPFYTLSINFGINDAPEYATSDLLEKEQQYWTNWLDDALYPSHINAKELELYKQSLVVLKMAQCRENGKSFGQILASLVPGMWNICWIRDASYALSGLIAAGKYEEARNGLTFFLEANVGKYKHFVIDDIDYGVGVDYQISVCRYYGSGDEESDGGNDPNIELDGFGLFLWTLHRYVVDSGDTKLLENYWDIISTKIATVLCETTDSLNIIQKDSSIWERHLINNGEDGAKHFTYTTLTAIKGLEVATELAKLMGDQILVEKYASSNTKLINGFKLYQIDANMNIIKDSMERTYPDYVDACVVEAINFDIIPSTDTTANNTINSFQSLLKMKNRPNGYHRNNGPSIYDRREWIVMDLRIATALKKMGRVEDSSILLDWVVEQSSKNFYIMAELYDENTANYEGAVPMCGFGPGAFVLYYWD